MIRTHIVVLASAMALFWASGATAQVPSGADSVRRQEQVRGKRRNGEGRQKMRREGVKSLLRDLNLSEAQRTQMKAVSEKYRTQFKTLRDTLQPDFEAARSARQRGDTVAARAAWERATATRERMYNLMEQQRAEVRALLTPEQQQVFDRNDQQMRKRNEERGTRKRPGRGR